MWKKEISLLYFLKECEDLKIEITKIKMTKLLYLCYLQDTSIFPFKNWQFLDCGVISSEIVETFYWLYYKNMVKLVKNKIILTKKGKEILKKEKRKLNKNILKIISKIVVRFKDLSEIELVALTSKEFFKSERSH